MGWKVTCVLAILSRSDIGFMIIFSKPCIIMIGVLDWIYLIAFKIPSCAVLYSGR